MITDERFDTLVTKAHDAAVRASEGSYPLVFAEVLRHLVNLETDRNTALFRRIMKVMRDVKKAAAESSSGTAAATNASKIFSEMLSQAGE